MARWEVFLKCDRCKATVHGFADFDQDGLLTATSMFYMRPAWEKYMNPGEVQVCDACVQADPLWQKNHGPQGVLKTDA